MIPSRAMLVVLVLISAWAMSAAASSANADPAYPARAQIVEYELELALRGPTGPEILTVQLYAIDDGAMPIEQRMAEGRAAMQARFPGATPLDPSSVHAAFKLFPTPVRWAQPSASWLYNPAGATPSMPGDSSFEAIQAGAAGWDNSGGSGFHFDYLGTTTTATGCNGDTSAYSRDGVNAIGWGHIVGGHLGFSCHWRSASLVDGTPYFALQEIDIVFEPQFAFTAQSLQALALHEFGHALGLDHTEQPACPGKAMCGGANAMIFASPQQDDLFGVIALYGVAQTPPVPPIEDRPFRAVAPSLSRDAGS